MHARGIDYAGSGSVEQLAGGIKWGPGLLRSVMVPSATVVRPTM